MQHWRLRTTAHYRRLLTDVFCRWFVRVCRRTTLPDVNYPRSYRHGSLHSTRRTVGYTTGSGCDSRLTVCAGRYNRIWFDLLPYSSRCVRRSAGPALFVVTPLQHCTFYGYALITHILPVTPAFVTPYPPLTGWLLRHAFTPRIYSRRTLLYTGFPNTPVTHTITTPHFTAKLHCPTPCCPPTLPADYDVTAVCCNAFCC